MRSFDQRFKPHVNATLLEHVTDAPAGSTATIRGIEFRKDTRWRWHNDFRSGMTNREVASVLQEGLADSSYTLTHPAQQGAQA